jgi:hypothetical protein
MKFCFLDLCLRTEEAKRRQMRTNNKKDILKVQLNDRLKNESDNSAFL